MKTINHLRVHAEVARRRSYIKFLSAINRNLLSHIIIMFILWYLYSISALELRCLIHCPSQPLLLAGKCINGVTKAVNSGRELESAMEIAH